jgi:hypothetical protein
VKPAGAQRATRRGNAQHQRCDEIEKRFPGLLAAIMNAHRIQSADCARTIKRQQAAARKQAG